jgi:hypothetical protein
MQSQKLKLFLTHFKRQYETVSRTVQGGLNLVEVWLKFKKCGWWQFQQL